MKTIFILLISALPFIALSQPLADFSFQQTECEGSTYIFNNNSSDDVVEHLWDFGDGNTSTQVSPTYTYFELGTYTVCLLVADNSGNTSTICQDIEVLQLNPFSIEQYIGCKGDGYSVVVNGNLYDEDNPLGLETLNTANTCDSIVLVELIFSDNSSNTEIYYACEGDSVDIAGTEILVNSAGCDSIVQIIVEYQDELEEYISYEGCHGDGYSIVVNETIYDESNPAGIEVLSTNYGCDSIVIVDLHYFTTSHGKLLIEGCVNQPFTFEIGGITYSYPPLPDLSNIPPLTNSYGCDSIITVSIILENTIEEQISYLGCTGDGYSVEINGVIYNENNPIGSEYINLQDDCDSLINIDLHFSNIETQSNIIPAYCQAGQGGTIEINAIGGVGPYQYSWSNGANGPEQIDLIPGAYQVTVMDAIGCIFIEDFLIEDYNTPDIDFEYSINNCLGDGYINTIISGGNPPFLYQWDNGMSTSDISQLLAGWYSLTITDNEGCTFIENILLEPSEIEFYIETTFKDCDEDNGTATAMVNTASGQAEFEWNTGATSASIGNLSAGWYSVTITDPSTSCAVQQNFTIEVDPECYMIISGRVLLENTITDCAVDDETEGLNLLMVQLSDGQITFTNSDGYYEFKVQDFEEYTIEVNTDNLPFETNCPTPIIINAIELGQHYGSNNFFFEYIDAQDLSVTIVTGNARPGFEQWVNVCLTNDGAVPLDGLLNFQHPSIQELISSTPTNNSYNANNSTLSWNIVDIAPGETKIYSLILYTPTETELETTLTYNATAFPEGDDLTPANNQFSTSIEVTGSYDPNDKNVAPKGLGNNGVITLSDSILNYRIRFQNTGTDTAFTVLIRDTIDANLNINSIVPGPASHPFTATIRTPNVLELLFENILLPDSSTNEAASHGYVFFDIKIRDDVPYGTQIENKAAIYFDFNAPIITNTVSNLIEMPAATKNTASNIALAISPNPFNDFYSLSFVLEKPTSLEVRLLDVNGKVVQQGISFQRFSIGEHSFQINTNSLPVGLYFLNLTTEDGNHYASKLLKIK